MTTPKDIAAKQHADRSQPTVGDMIRELKARMGITATDIAKAVGVSHGTINRMRKVEPFHADGAHHKVIDFYWRTIVDAPAAPVVNGTTQEDEIVRLALAGESMASIGRQFGVSRQWVSQLVKRHAVTGSAATRKPGRPPKN